MLTDLCTLYIFLSEILFQSREVLGNQINVVSFLTDFCLFVLFSIEYNTLSFDAESVSSVRVPVEIFKKSHTRSASS